MTAEIIQLIGCLFFLRILEKSQCITFFSFNLGKFWQMSARNISNDTKDDTGFQEQVRPAGSPNSRLRGWEGMLF